MIFTPVHMGLSSEEQERKILVKFVLQVVLFHCSGLIHLSINLILGVH